MHSRTAIYARRQREKFLRIQVFCVVIGLLFLNTSKNIPRKIQCTINMHIRCAACLTAEEKISMVFLEW
jgi:hypothetical protein